MNCGLVQLVSLILGHGLFTIRLAFFALQLLSQPLLRAWFFNTRSGSEGSYRSRSQSIPRLPTAHRNALKSRAATAE